MIFSGLLRRLRGGYDSEPEYDQSEYAALETQNIVHELNLSDAAQAKKYVVDLCKQMVQASREIEDIRSEYELVTTYLTDIQTLEDLEDTDKKPIVESATHVAKLEKQRTEFLKTERRLTDAQYAQMQDEEERLPGVIRRLKENEADMDKLRRSLAYLEGKKLEWSMQHAEAQQTQKRARTLVCYLLAVFVTFMALFGVLSWYFGQDLQLLMTVVAFVAVVVGTVCFVRYQDASHAVRQADVNRNHAVTLENRVKIRFVNTKNAVDYICEKYHVRNAGELQYLYEQYLEEAREKETFRKTSDDLEFYRSELLQYLTRLRLYDTRVWLNHANAFVDSREMVELKHELLTRRQKLRGRIEYNIGSIRKMKEEARKNMPKLGSQAYQLEQIIRQLETLNPGL